MLALLVIPGGCGSGSSSTPTPTPTQGTVVVGFVDSPFSGFQQILFNVVAVRINPNGDLTIAEDDPNWKRISVAPGLGAQGELQIDLNLLQNQAQLFGRRGVAAQEYRQAELELDQNTPGILTPNCPQAPTLAEGCMRYPFQLESLNPLRTNIALQIGHGGVAPLVLDINPGAVKPPARTGGFYTINPSITVSIASQYLGEVSGKVSGVPIQGAAIKAELHGTGDPIASAPVKNDGTYVLELPAQDVGSSYDIFARGDGVLFSAASGVMVMRGAQITQDFSVATAQTAFIAGVIKDAQTGLGISGATINLLAPPAGQSFDCQSTPSKCVIVAKGTTDDVGNYPLSGNISHPAFFNEVPLGTYTLQVTAAGYDNVVATVPVNTESTEAVCGPPGTTTYDCSFNLNSTTISGNVSVAPGPAPGADVQVLVMAEDSGTNNLENVTMTTIPGGATSAPFTLNVPTSVAGFDLFSSAVDFYNGRPSPFPGHQIEVLSNVPGGATNQNFPALDCMGHGSLTGEVAVTPDSGTTVVLSKGNVQLMETGVGASMSSNAGQFSFCAPPDTYTLQRYEDGAPASAPTAVTVAAPAATSSPCPGICGFASGQCAGICNNTPIDNPL